MSKNHHQSDQDFRLEDYNPMIKVPGGTASIQGIELKLDTFFMSQYPVTQDLYQAVTGTNPSHFRGPRRPVERVSWVEALLFCNLLSEKEGREPVYQIQDLDKGRAFADYRQPGYRLPTEAEWEYAALGGANQPAYAYVGSDKLAEVGWYDNNSQEESKAVGLKLPNALGLYDMSGNVWEWCEDDYDQNFFENIKDSENPVNIESREIKALRVVRAGSWFNLDVNAARSLRNGDHYFNRGYGLGFRLVRGAF